MTKKPHSFICNNIITQIFFYASQNFLWIMYLRVELQDPRNSNDNRWHYVSAYSVPNIVLSGLYIFTHLIHTITLWGFCYCLYFSDKK